MGKTTIATAATIGTIWRIGANEPAPKRVAMPPSNEPAKNARASSSKTTKRVMLIRKRLTRLDAEPFDLRRTRVADRSGHHVPAAVVLEHAGHKQSRRMGANRLEVKEIGSNRRSPIHSPNNHESPRVSAAVGSGGDLFWRRTWVEAHPSR